LRTAVTSSIAAPIGLRPTCRGARTNTSSPERSCAFAARPASIVAIATVANRVRLWALETQVPIDFVLCIAPLSRSHAAKVQWRASMPSGSVDSILCFHEVAEHFHLGGIL